MPYATASDGCRIYYEATGSGPAILAASPFAATGVWWLPHAAAKYRDDLARDYRVILIDAIRGGGRTDAIYPEVFMPAIAVSDLLAVADAAGAQRFAWLGFSWSAVIGLQLALRSDRLTALMCGGWSPLDGPYRETAQIAEKVSRMFPFRQFQKVKDSTRMYMQFYGELAQWSVTDQQKQIATIQCPKLLFLGDRDNMHKPFRVALAPGAVGDFDQRPAQGQGRHQIPQREPVNPGTLRRPEQKPDAESGNHRAGQQPGLAATKPWISTITPIADQRINQRVPYAHQHDGKADCGQRHARMLGVNALQQRLRGRMQKRLHDRGQREGKQHAAA